MPKTNPNILTMYLDADEAYAIETAVRYAYRRMTVSDMTLDDSERNMTPEEFVRILRELAKQLSET